MTANRDLKRRVRDRQAQTGESYMTALHHVLAQRPGGITTTIPTVEFVDVTAVAAALGMKCRFAVSPALAHDIDVERTLERFRDALLATQRDPGLVLMQAIALHGEHVHFPLATVPRFHDIQSTVTFLKRVMAGFGGISDNGRILALRAVPRVASGGSSVESASAISRSAVTGEPFVVISPWSVPALAAIGRSPLLIVNAIDDYLPDMIAERFGIGAP
jgi:hypothetical protein